MEKEKKNSRHQQPHAWRGTWDRPLDVDEDSLDALTVARMTDHNVRGSDEEKDEAEKAKPPVRKLPKTAI